MYINLIHALGKVKNFSQAFRNLRILRRLTLLFIVKWCVQKQAKFALKE